MFLLGILMTQKYILFGVIPCFSPNNFRGQTTFHKKQPKYISILAKKFLQLNCKQLHLIRKF